MHPRPLHRTRRDCLGLESVVMDRPPHEPPTAYVEHPTSCRIHPFPGASHIWNLPVGVRVKHSGLKQWGSIAPADLCSKPQCSTLSLKGTPHILTYKAGNHWLVTTFDCPGGSTPTDLFVGEAPMHRVDGGYCTLRLSHSPKGVLYVANIDISRATLAPMATRVLESEPGSRILVRLSPRVAKGAFRWFPDLRHIQFWTAI